MRDFTKVFTNWQEITIYEPRWHGFARWELAEHSFLTTSLTIDIVKVRTIKKGWTRRPRGSKILSFVAKPRAD
jgi:hypothetical protein